ncbi:Transcriptional regulatory protein CpxR [Thiocapsa sp. KS1]|jgi:DNA-binding response OmpR family regulator|nr:response regulator transcription factor [Thiocapsa sp. KS1]CRI63737.1 Transcriptional regulatory protein CpxR [Thiocapsa sp. KS1]
MRIRVLLVDDDLELGEMLIEYFEREGIQATAVQDGETGVGRALSGEFDILVLDVMMPGVNGIEALRRIRARNSRIPILMLTARGDDVDRIVGLELGADDYVPKPCTPRELVARIRAILRRTQAPEPADLPTGPLTEGALTLWPEQRRATWQDEPLTLTSTEFNLLEVLVREAGRVVTKQVLSEQGLGRPLARYDRGIDVHLSSIRHKLGTDGAGRSPIQTVRGVGYQYVRSTDG